MISLCSFTRKGLRFPEWLPHDKNNNNNLFSTDNNICSIHQWLKMMKLLLLLISEMEGPLQQVQLLNLLLERSMIFNPCPFRFHEASYHHAALSVVIIIVILQGCIENPLVWHRMKEEYANLAGTKPSGCFIDNRSVNDSWFSITFIYLHATSFLGGYTKSSRPDTNSYNTIWSKWQKCQSN